MRADYEDAQREYMLAIMVDSKDSYAHSTYGFFLLTARKDYQGAERKYKLVIKFDPTKSVASHILSTFPQRKALSR